MISFDGHGVISYHFRSKKIKIVKDVISLKFRTTAGAGVLLHGEGQQGDYISLELRRARLQLSLNLGSKHVHNREPFLFYCGFKDYIILLILLHDNAMINLYNLSLCDLLAALQEVTSMVPSRVTHL